MKKGLLQRSEGQVFDPSKDQEPVPVIDNNKFNLK